MPAFLAVVYQTNVSLDAGNDILFKKLDLVLEWLYTQCVTVVQSGFTLNFFNK